MWLRHSISVLSYNRCCVFYFNTAASLADCLLTYYRNKINQRTVT